MRMRYWLVLLCGALALAGCGGGSPRPWKDLRRASITLGNGSLPPPFGRPKTTVYSTPSELAQITAKLNAYRIARQSQNTSNAGCAGGYQVAISIVGASSPPVRLSAYRCADTTTGDIAGNLPGFLASLGLSAP
jgi:hypothetical protein